MKKRSSIKCSSPADHLHTYPQTNQDDIKAMKKVTRASPGLLTEIATLKAIAENFLDILEVHEIGPEGPRVWKRALVKQNKKGEEKIYYHWYCSWHDGNKTITKYLGSCRKISEADALDKARRLRSSLSTTSIYLQARPKH